MPHPLDEYSDLTPGVQQWVLERLVARLGDHPDLYPCDTEEEALALVIAELPRQITHERRFHINDPLLPCPPRSELRTCRCRALVYSDAATLIVLSAHTLASHHCPSSHPADLTEDTRAQRFHHEQRDQQRAKHRRLHTEGRAGLAATRQPQRTGLIRAHRS